MKRIIAAMLGMVIAFSGITTTAFAQSKFDIKVIEVDKEIKEIYDISDGMRRFMTLNRKYGFFNEGFDVIIPPYYIHANDFELYTTTVHDSFGYFTLDRQGNIAKYKYKTKFDENGIAVIAVGKKHAFVNDKGELLTGFKYDELSRFSNGYAIAVINDFPSAILIDENFNEIVLEEYTAVRDILDNGNIVVRNKEGLFGIINQNFEVLTPTFYFHISANDIEGRIGTTRQPGPPYAVHTVDDKEGCIDGNGEIIVPAIYTLIFKEYKSGYIIAKPDLSNRYVLLNPSGEYVCDTDIYRYSPMITDGQIIGYIDGQEGRYIGKYDINIVSSYVDGVALAMRQVPNNDNNLDEAKYGLVDMYGNIVHDFDIPICDEEYPDHKGYLHYRTFPYSISDSMVAVRIDGKWGYIDLEGNMIISPQYNSADDFVCGYAKVDCDGDIFYIDKQGNRHDNLSVYGYEMDNISKSDEENYVDTDLSFYLLSNPQFKRKDKTMQKGAYYMIHDNGHISLVTDGITVFESRGNNFVDADGKVILENCCGEYESEIDFIGANELFVKTPSKNYVLQITREDLPREVILNVGKKGAIADGQSCEAETVPIIADGQLMVPLRFVAENIGARVCYTEKTNLIAVTLGDKKFAHILGTDTAIVNGETVALDMPTYTENDKTYIPLSSLAESLGLKVEWLQENEQFKITT